MIRTQKLMTNERLLNAQRLAKGDESINGINSYLQKINHCLDFDSYDNNDLYDNDPESITYNDKDPIMLQRQIRRSAQYLQTLKRNSFKVFQLVKKIQQLIMDNDRMRKQGDLQRKTIEMHLRKQIQLKYVISTLQEQLQIVNHKFIALQTLNTKQQPPSPKGPSSKQVYKLQQKLQNCMQQNNILRQENQSFRQVQFSKQQNYAFIQNQFKSTLSALNAQMQSLKADLHYEQQKTLLFDKIQAQNVILKTQNKRIQTIMDTKLIHYQTQISNLLKQLNHFKQGKQIFQEKYQELTDIITMVDQMRVQFKTKKKTIQYHHQSLNLLQPIELTSNYPLMAKTIPLNVKKTQQNKSKLTKKQNSS